MHLALPLFQISRRRFWSGLATTPFLPGTFLLTFPCDGVVVVGGLHSPLMIDAACSLMLFAVIHPWDRPK